MDREREMAAVIRALWKERTDTELAKLMTNAWGVSILPEVVVRLRKALGFVRLTDSVHRLRGRPPGGKLKPEPDLRGHSEGDESGENEK
jgi:hypothetical protein